MKLLVFLFSLVACSVASVTLSGVSSGASFAVQFHVAHSSSVDGVGVIAGAPYWCSQGSSAVSLSNCQKSPNSISISNLVAYTTNAFSNHTIDNPSNLAKSKVFLFSGTLDTVVAPGVVKKLATYYQTYISSENISTVYNIPSEHAFITNNFGKNCSYLGDPYINNCQYDFAGTILKYLLGNLSSPVPAVSGNLVTITQTTFLPPSVLPSTAAIGPNAYLYVPTACQKTKGCRVHVAFHGCVQTLDDINTTFVTKTGYNEWAEANNIIVLYPQAIVTKENPKGCWDWWGYTGSAYATQSGPQIITIKNMIDSIGSGGGKIVGGAIASTLLAIVISLL